MINSILFIEYRQHSQGEILNNFEHYERLFKESATVPPSVNAIVNGSDNNLTYSAIIEAAIEPRVENPHFSSPETFHNAMSFRSYDNHGFGKSISSLLDTFSENDSLKPDYLVDRDYEMGSSGSSIGGNGISLRGSFFSKERRDANRESKTFSERRSEFLRNTPADFPMIVREAMDKQDNSRRGKFAQARRQIPRQNAVWYVVEDDGSGSSNNSSQAPPTPSWKSAPETPLIENAPESIDFISATKNSTSKESNSMNPNDDETLDTATDTINVNDNNDDKMEIETPSSDINLNLENVFNKNKLGKNEVRSSSNFLNNIDAINFDDDMAGMPNNFENMHLSEEKLSPPLPPPPHSNDVNSNVGAKPKQADNEEDDDVFREYNSHQYWYISPDMPVDTDILLDPEEKSMFNFI